MSRTKEQFFEEINFKDELIDDVYQYEMWMQEGKPEKEVILECITDVSSQPLG